MCLVGRLARHMWKCHKIEYRRDLDAQLDVRCGKLFQSRLQQQQQQQQRSHSQQEEVEESWDNNNYPTYVPLVKPWSKTQFHLEEEEKKEEESWDDDNHPTYVPQITPKWKTRSVTRTPTTTTTNPQSESCVILIYV
jgi:hypothetical protein